MSAQSSSKPGDAVPEILLYLGLFILATILLGLLITYIRRRLLANEDASAAASDSNIINHLRALRDAGELSSEAYAHAVSQLRNRLLDDPSTPPPPPPPPPLSSSSHPPAAKGDNSPLTARPGYDLLGRPLPKPGPDASQDE